MEYNYNQKMSLVYLKCKFNWLSYSLASGARCPTAVSGMLGGKASQLAAEPLPFLASALGAGTVANGLHTSRTPRSHWEEERKM